MALTSVAQVLDTLDVEEARATIGAGYCEHRLEILPARGRLHAVQTEWRVGRVRVHRLKYGVDVRIDAAPLESSVLVSTPVRGTLTVLAGGVERRYGPGHVVAIGPDRPFGLRWEGDCELRTVQIERSVLESDGHADTCGLDPLDPQHEASPRHAESWARLTALLEAQAMEEGCTELVASSLESLVAASVRAHHGRTAGTADRRTPTPREVRTVVDYIEAHADQPVSLADMASAAHMSVRALQYSLKRHVDMTPSEFLRSVRLDRAHRDLLASDASETTVGHIAQQWGFGNLGRFSRYYMERFGRLPSQTLRDENSR